MCRLRRFPKLDKLAQIDTARGIAKRIDHHNQQRWQRWRTAFTQPDGGINRPQEFNMKGGAERAPQHADNF
jgi:hypothetical protein